MMKEIIQPKEIEIPVVKKRQLEKLDGTIFAPVGEGPFPTVVFYHGRQSSKSLYLPTGQELAVNGIVALAFDFSNDELKDREIEAEAAYFYLQGESYVNSRQVGIVGSAMGAITATIIAIAKNFEAKSLVLRAPAAFPEAKKSSSISALRNFKGSLLIIQSELDEVIPHGNCQLCFDIARRAALKEWKVIKGATHWLGEPNSPQRKEFRQIVVDWFKRTLV